MVINGRRYKDTLSNARKLAAAGVQFEGPVTRRYEFKSQYAKPFDYQVETVDFITKYHRGWVFNAIGTGKTLCMYWAYDFMRSVGEATKLLVVSTLSTLDDVHAETLSLSFPHLTYEVLHGEVKKRRRLLASDVDVYIINYEGLKILENDLGERTDIDCVFIDEAAKFRNKHAIWKAANNIFGPLSSKIVWGFTGAPTPNSPLDCYYLAKLINPLALPQQPNWRTGEVESVPFYKFRAMIMDKDPYSRFKWTPKPDWERICPKTLSPSIRFTRRVEGLKSVKMYRKVAMSPEQLKIHKAMATAMTVQMAQGDITAVNAAAKAAKLLQISSGIIYDENKLTYEVGLKNKLAETISLVEEASPSHVVVFVPFKGLLSLISKGLTKHFGTPPGIICGEVPKKERTGIFSAFTTGDLRILLAVPDAMCHGLNLQNKSRVIIWWGPTWKAEIYEQACGRVDREGQRKEVLIVHLYSSELEKMYFSNLEKKQSCQKLLLAFLKKEKR